MLIRHLNPNFVGGALCILSNRSRVSSPAVRKASISAV